MGVGLALTDQITGTLSSSSTTATTPQSNLSRVNADGTTSEALESGAANISRFMIAPNGKVYLLFAEKTNLETSEIDQDAGSLLAEVDISTGVPLPIESDLQQINWNDDLGYYRNDPIQFDSQGAIYYLGTSANGNQVLRKFFNGTTTDLVNDNIMVNDFAVSGDGSVFIIGATVSPTSYWLRRIRTNGSLQNVAAGLAGEVRFLKLFPDDNLYFGSFSDPNGIARFFTETESLDSAPWIATDSGSAYTSPESAPFMSQLNDIFTILNTKVFATYSNSGPKTLVQVFPELSLPETLVTKVTVANTITTNIVLAGLDDANQNRLVMHNTSDGSETDLLDGYDIEVYRINYVAAQNQIMFDGLNFENNTMVIGAVSLNDLQVNLTTIGSGSASALLDFRTF